jgi:hypothetical protein
VTVRPAAAFDLQPAATPKISRMTRDQYFIGKKTYGMGDELMCFFDLGVAGR